MFTSKLTLVVLVALFAAAFVGPSRGLSWPLCDQGGAVWVTEKPKTDPKFPGADLWFFCEGSLNILGKAIDSCVPNPASPNGTTCVPQVPTAICQLLGYEEAFNEDTVVTPATPSQAVISLTGQYCVRQGQYSDTLPSDLASIPGQPCNVIQKLTCIRTLSTLAAAATLGLQQLDGSLTFLHPTPAAENLAQTAQVAQTLAEQAATNVPLAEAVPGVMPVAVGGRRLK